MFISVLAAAVAFGQPQYSFSLRENKDGVKVAKVLSAGKTIWQKPYPNAWVIGGASKDRKSFAFYDGSWRMTIWQAPGKVSTFAASPFPKDPIWADAPCIDELYWSPDKKRIFGIFGSSGGLSLGLGGLVVFRVQDRKTYLVNTKEYVKKAQWTGDRTLKVWQKSIGIGEPGKAYKPITIRVR